MEQWELRVEQREHTEPWHAWWYQKQEQLGVEKEGTLERGAVKASYKGLDWYSESGKVQKEMMVSLGKVGTTTRLGRTRGSWALTRNKRDGVGTVDPIGDLLFLGVRELGERSGVRITARSTTVAS